MYHTVINHSISVMNYLYFVYCEPDGIINNCVIYALLTKHRTQRGHLHFYVLCCNKPQAPSNCVMSLCDVEYTNTHQSHC